MKRNDTEESAGEYDEIAEKRHKKLRAARPQAKELDHGFPSAARRNQKTDILTG